MGSWRLIFNVIAVVSLVVAIWFVLRMPETLAEEDRQSLDPGRVVRDYALVVRDRNSLGYTLAGSAMGGALFGFLGSIQQIVADFESRSEHLTGVAIADTALMLERFAARRGLAAHPASALLPSM